MSERKRYTVWIGPTSQCYWVTALNPEHALMKAVRFHQEDLIENSMSYERNRGVERAYDPADGVNCYNGTIEFNATVRLGEWTTCGVAIRDGVIVWTL